MQFYSGIQSMGNEKNPPPAKLYSSRHGIGVIENLGSFNTSHSSTNFCTDALECLEEWHVTSFPFFTHSSVSHHGGRSEDTEGWG